VSRLRSYGRLPKKSAKVTEGEAAYRRVYDDVDKRSDGFCEVELEHLGRLRRCPARATDHHHLVKPRRSHHTPEQIAHVCRPHHDRCTWPYDRGRLVGSVLGGGRFSWVISFLSWRRQGA
jgi:hypothetical protein